MNFIYYRNTLLLNFFLVLIILSGTTVAFAASWLLLFERGLLVF